MKFMLHWNGNGTPTKAEAEALSLSFSGAERPKEITFLSNSSTAMHESSACTSLCIYCS